ncbi:CPBP family intramembrane glutamic endopeptidase [Gracilinema caldarium]|uniref:CPBP family intramembrane glutamic endopeptidase n=1 Tax=Gracilinema caldarium TaxID=215591 RepID=UPI0026EB8615|nr:CPBP family intramembrane glutamic endopeptidase [Gracilinema caldarium]
MNRYLNQVHTGKNDRWRWLGFLVVSIILWIVLLLGLYMLYQFIKDIVDYFSPTIVNGAIRKGTQTYFDIFSVFINLGLYVPVFIVCFPLFFERPFKTAVTSHQYFNRSKVLRAFFIWLFLLLLPIVLSYAVDSKGSGLSIQFDSVKLLLSVIGALCFVPFQCFAEELFFRAYLMQGFYLFFKKQIFIVFVSSLLFLLAHVPNLKYSASGIQISGLLQYEILGLLFGLLVLLDEGLEGALGVHIANNVLGMILIEPAAGVEYYGQLFRNIGPNTGDGMFSILL